MGSFLFLKKLTLFKQVKRVLMEITGFTFGPQGVYLCVYMETWDLQGLKGTHSIGSDRIYSYNQF